MSRFFIDRPIFAWVIAIVIMLAGALAINNLPIAQYPTIAPPSVRISTSYPGASAKTVEDSVTQVLEQNMTGLDNLLYMSSQSDSSGNVTVSLNFMAGTNPDTAQVQVQNKVQQALSSLPQTVQNQGVHVEKSSSSFLMVAGLISENGEMDQSDLSDYLVTNIKEPLSRIEGVGSVQIFGAQYAMRVWLDPNKLNSYNLTPSDVTTAITSQNTQISVGQLGAAPSVAGQQFNATITGQSRLTSMDEFKNILLKVNTNGSQVRLRDVARVELGAESYNTVSRYNGMPASGIAINLATGANALQTAT
jgi:multidrug efflux pump